MQILVAAMNRNLEELTSSMKIASNAIVINQCDQMAYEEKTIWSANGEGVRHIAFYSLPERGVGLSRNTALMRATDDISLFSDEDIAYIDGYEELVEREFADHPEADVLLFQFDVHPERKTYDTIAYRRVRWYNCGRYPTFAMAIRTQRVIERNITFSLLFGGGARYSNGEDSLFLQECIRKGLRVYATPTKLGWEVARPSTWFQGYHEKFFHDRGVLYKHLYGRMATVFAFRFLWRHRAAMCQDISCTEAFRFMEQGIKNAFSDK